MNVRKIINTPSFIILSWVVVIVVAAVIAANIIRLQTNLLYRNTYWVSKKASLRKGVAGSVAYIVTPLALADGRLNLGVWSGYQEVLTKDTLSLSSAQFKFYLNENAYINFLFDGDEEGFSGIRLSNNNLFKNMTFVVDSEGKFLQKTPFAIGVVQSKRWNELKMVFFRNRYTAYLNDEYLGSGVYKKTEQRIGFRGGMAKTLIDDVVLNFQDPRREVYESFNNTSAFSIALVIALVILIGLNCMFFFWFRAKERKDFPYSEIIKWNVSLALSLIIVNIYVWYSSGRYPLNYHLINWRGFESTSDNQQTVVDTIARAYGTNVSDKLFRVILMGTSQTWGAGASDDNKAFSVLLEKLLNDQGGNTYLYEVINAGISGATSKDLADIYLAQWVKLKPKIVIINLSNNDSTSQILKANLERIVAMNKSQNIRTVFMLEPNSPEVAKAMSEHLNGNHRIMMRVAEEQGIPYIDMHNFLLNYYDDGFIWWDGVHLTDYGQSRVAGKLYQEIKKSL